MREMPDTQAPDDIFALFSRFDLDMAQYRVFQREVPKLESASAQTESVRPAAIELPVAVETKVPEPARTLAEMVETESVSTTRTALNSLQRVMQVNREWSKTRAHAPATAVSIVGAAGGVGVTTIAATLARQLNKEGARCAIYDSGAETLLPVFFENRQLTSRHHRFSGLHSLLDSSVQILNAQSCTGMDWRAGDDSANWIDDATRHFSADFDHLFFDCGRKKLPHSEGLKIHVAIPDVASVFGMQRLAGAWDAEGRKENAICVLNRFDSSIALHQELRSWYEDHFAEVFTIDNSQLVPEALAEGATVTDWAPQSDAAGDFIRLSGYVKRASQKKAQSTATLKTQPEGLALCS